jgi:WD40 repeat protein
VSASLDGFVRIYAADRYDKPAVPKTKVPGINRHWSVAFSPDGRHIAVGGEDSATIAVLRDRDLAPEAFPAVTDLGATGLTVAWSQDGKQLFTEGVQLDHFDRLARRWDKGGSGRFVDIVGARDLAIEFLPLPDHQMLYGDGEGFG